MRVAQLAPLWKEVPPKKYGGSELVVANLTEGLVKLGAEVTLFACGGSKTSAKLVEVIDRPMYDLLDGFSWGAIQAYEFLEYADLIKRLDEFDVVHNHLGFHPLVFSPLFKIPVVTTLHSSLPPDFPYLAERFKDNYFVSISQAQRGLAPYLNYIETIYHGIDTANFNFNLKADNDYLLFVGSLTPNKGIDIAIQAALETNEKLIIAGEVREGDKDFLEHQVYPFIDNSQIKFLGEVNHQQKSKLYAHAKALVLPVRWNEAFGLVMAESLACGTPVIAFNKGSVPEVITNGETGFVVNNFSEFKKAINQISQISRLRCRKEAEERFDISVMAKNYLNLYQKLSR